MNMTSISVRLGFFFFLSHPPLHACEWILMSWIDTRCGARRNAVNTGKPPSVSRRLYLHGLQRYDERRRGLFNLWVVVWSVAFIAIQEWRCHLFLSLSLSLPPSLSSLSLFLSWLLWRRLPQRFASADSSSSSSSTGRAARLPTYERKTQPHMLHNPWYLHSWAQAGN